MTLTATIEKTADAQKIGEYSPTEIDAAKDGADIRIIDIDGTATVKSRIEISGKGITPRATCGYYEVTKAALSKLQKKFNVVTDF